MHARINAGISCPNSNVLCNALEGRPGELHPLPFHLGIESIGLLAELIDCQPSNRTPANGIADTSSYSLSATHRERCSGTKAGAGRRACCGAG
jgi:hypothetical protein